MTETDTQRRFGKKLQQSHVLGEWVMKARPILFSGEMVRAILEGRKTQTRRVVKDAAVLTMPEIASEHCKSLCPHGQIGDLLWVRENWRTFQLVDSVKPRDLSQHETIHFEANGRTRGGNVMNPTARGKVRPNIFLPKWASRLTLEITDIRVERLQDISEEDALAEGAIGAVSLEEHESGACAKYQFLKLWDSINGAESWNANPWVWVIEFTPHQINVNDYLETK